MPRRQQRGLASGEDEPPPPEEARREGQWEELRERLGELYLA